MTVPSEQNGTVCRPAAFDKVWPYSMLSSTQMCSVGLVPLHMDELQCLLS